MSILGKFPRSFWVGNFMELFERMSYYGMFNVLALYLTGAVGEGCLGFSKEQTGLMMGIYTFFLYMLPIFGGAVAERYGYKRSFVIALSTLSLAYFLSGNFRTYGGIFAALLMVSIGGALFKPTLTGTISRTTDEKTCSLGFGIYYMIVNIGGFAGPFVASYLRAHNWQWVFWASALWVGLMLLPAIFLYKEPREASEVRSSCGVGKVLMNSVGVLRNWRFIILLVIFSGFWVMFFQLYLTMTLYLRDHVNTVPILQFLKDTASHLYRPWADVLQGRLALVASGQIRVGEAIPPEILTDMDAAAIIIFQILVSRISGMFKPLHSMIAGVLLSAGAMFLAGSTRNPWLVVLSIVLLAFGEMAASPKFLEYVGRIAPKDKVAVFLGYGFLPIGIGSLIANVLGGKLYAASDAHLISLSTMWYIIGCVGLLTAFLLFLYNVFLAPGLHEASAMEEKK
ncbi:MAG: MFS transporter [bacterium]